MGQIIDFLSRMNKTKEPVIPPPPIPRDQFDFDEELANLLGITQELADATSPSEVKHLLSQAIDHVMTWPDDG